MLSKEPSGINAVLTTKIAVISDVEALSLAEVIFGVKAQAKHLTSERDQNFHLRSSDGKEYILKITNAAEERQITDFQTQAMLHIARVDPDLAVPRVFPSRQGEYEPVAKISDGTSRVVRLLSWLPGAMLHGVERNSALRRNLGAMLARLDLALRGFFHPAAGHELLWDIKHSSRLRPLMQHITETPKRALAERFLDNFETHALPVMPKLRGQVIHNDSQPWNVLIDEKDHAKVAGVIDFGDLVYAPMIDDLAVACAYHVACAREPLDHICEVVAGYNAVLPLEEAEIDILYDLIAVRLSMTVAITGWRAALHPENAAYILRNNALSWTGLERFDALARSAAQKMLRAACR